MKPPDVADTCGLAAVTPVKGTPMARKVQILLEDDLDGSVADETVTFSLDGTNYEIDLSKTNAKRLRDALAPYLAAGRTVAARRTAEKAADARPTRTARKKTASKAAKKPAKATGPKKRRPTGARAAGVDPAAVRAWAQSHGVKVNPRGRIAMETINAFRAAGN